MLDKKYLEDPRMSQSKLKNILYGLDEFRYRRDNPMVATEAMNFGSAVHLLLLQPHLNKKVVIIDKPSGTTRIGKAYKYLMEAHIPGSSRDEEFEKLFEKEICILEEKYQEYFDNPSEYIGLNRDEYRRSQRIVENIKKNTDCDYLLGQCHSFETNRYYTHKCIDFKAQLDCVADGFIIDIKTTSTVNDPRKIKYTILDYMYHFQAASYLLSDPSFIQKDYYIIFVRTKAPYSVFPVKLSARLLDDGLEKFDMACDIYNDCLINNPQFTSNNKIREIE